MISSLLRERLILTDHCCKQEILTYRYAVIEFEPTETMNKPKTIKNETLVMTYLTLMPTIVHWNFLGIRSER